MIMNEQAGLRKYDLEKLHTLNYWNVPMRRIEQRRWLWTLSVLLFGERMVELVVV